jgi:hypothetical protein
MEMHPEIVEAEYGAVVPRSRQQQARESADVSTASAASAKQGEAAAKSGASALAAAIASLSTPKERETAALVLDAVVSSCRDALRLRFAVDADALEALAAAAVKTAVASAVAEPERPAPAALGSCPPSRPSDDDSDDGAVEEVHGRRWSQLQSSARQRASLRRVSRIEASKVVLAAQALAEASAAGGTLSQAAASAEAAAATAAAANVDTSTQARPLAVASSRGVGTLFAYASGLKLSLQAVQRKVEVCLPYGIAPTSDAPPALITDHGTNTVEAAGDDADDAPICVCRKPWSQDTSYALCCSQCDEWYHAKCIGLTQIDDDHVQVQASGDIIDVSGSWNCPKCSMAAGPEPSKRPRGGADKPAEAQAQAASASVPAPATSEAKRSKPTTTKPRATSKGKSASKPITAFFKTSSA